LSEITVKSSKELLCICRRMASQAASGAYPAVDEFVAVVVVVVIIGPLVVGLNLACRKATSEQCFSLKKNDKNRFERDLSWALTWIWLINAHFCRRIRSQPFQRQTYSVRYLTWFEQVWWKTDRAVGNDLNERTSVFVRLGTRERERESRVTFGNCPIRRCNPIGWHSSVWSRVRPVLFSVLVAFSCSTFDFVSSSASSLVLPVVLRAFV